MAAENCDDIAKETEDQENDEDRELAELLRSALGDFDRQKPTVETVAVHQPAPPSSSSNSKLTKKQSKERRPEPPFDPAMMQEVDNIFKNMMSQDPQLKDHWDKLAESCSRAAENGSEEDFEKSLQDTLKKMTENVQSLPNNTDIPDEELAKIWANLGMNGGESGASNGVLPDIMPLVTNMMQNLLSKDILYPALKDLTDKYPAWLHQNSSKLSDEDLKRYEKQLQLMRQVCHEFEAESPDDSDATKKERFQQILTTMQAMQECGSPPKDLVGDVPEMGSPELDFSKIPGFNPSGFQCCIQ